MEKQPVEGEARRGKVVRARYYAALAHARAEQVKVRAHQERSRHASVDTMFEIVDRDGEVGGGIIAGALAYRFFIWILPLALVAVAGLGIAADAASESPGDAARSVGLAGLVTSSISGAADSSKRWYALIVGIPILVYVTRSVLRSFIGAHRLVWTDVRAAAPKPTLAATLRLLVLMLAYFLVSGLAAAIRSWSPGFGILATILIVVVYAGLWLVISLRLPHRDAPWVWLLPGAFVVGVGIEAMHVFTVYFLVPYAINKQGTYGALGAAAALLFGLYILSRLIVGSADVNATLWERHTRGAADDSGSPPPAPARQPTGATET